MTRLLEKAFARASALTAEEQDILAQSLLNDLAAEELWDETLRSTQDELSKLADEALFEHKAGRTSPLEELV